LVGVKARRLAINGRALDFGCVPDREVAPREAVERVVAHAHPLAEWASLDAVIPFSTTERGSVPDSAISTSAAAALARKLGITTLPIPSTTVTGLVDALSGAEYLLSTRMHGFIIGLMLGCRAANLDYIWGGGRMHHFSRPSAPGAG
jgi:hypothetical protein